MTPDSANNQESATGPAFRTLVLTEHGGQHGPFVATARKWLADLAREHGFACDYAENTDAFDDAFLAKYRLFIQLDFAPYGWKPKAAAAFQSYIDEGRGGWIGFHHATLLGEFDGHKMWPWFHAFMGSIRFDNYIASLAAGTVRVEDATHPVMRGVPASFTIPGEEWYTYDKSPRPNVRVLASVDESTYAPVSAVRMGDHPVVWTNERVKARNVYIFMGHGPSLFELPAFTTLFSNSILWASGGKA